MSLPVTTATPGYTTPRHDTSCHATPGQATPSRHAMPRHVTRCHATPRHAIPWDATTRQTTLHHASQRHVTPSHAMPHQVTLCHTMSLHGTPRHGTPQHFKTRFTTPRQAIHVTSHQAVRTPHHRHPPLAINNSGTQLQQSTTTPMTTRAANGVSHEPDEQLEALQERCCPDRASQSTNDLGTLHARTMGRLEEV